MGFLPLTHLTTGGLGFEVVFVRTLGEYLSAKERYARAIVIAEDCYECYSYLERNIDKLQGYAVLVIAKDVEEDLVEYLFEKGILTVPFKLENGVEKPVSKDSDNP